MPTYHIVYADWHGGRVTTKVRAKSLTALLEWATRAPQGAREIISASIVEKRTRATRMRKWDARDLAEELRGRNGWRREGMANERREGRQLDRDFPKVQPVLTPPNVVRFLQGLIAHRTAAEPRTIPNSADSARR